MQVSQPDGVNRESWHCSCYQIFFLMFCFVYLSILLFSFLLGEEVTRTEGRYKEEDGEMPGIGVHNANFTKNQ